MAISEEQVRHVAMLARLGLTDEQVAHLSEELNDILVQIDRIQALDLAGRRADDACRRGRRT